jgi:hypothetical protein
MRSFLTVLLLALPAFAQEAGGFTAGSGARPLESIVRDTREASPVATQERMFPGTRLWRLDPGNISVESWVTAKIARGGDVEGLWELEFAIGVTRHLQIDVYENLSFGTGIKGLGVDGTALEARISLGTFWNELWGNPVIYLEWQNRKLVQDRAELRVLLGGDAPWKGFWAVNLYGEMNVDYFKLADSEGTDAEFGATGATNYTLIPDVLRVGVEARLGGDQHGSPTFYASGFLGPNVILLAPGTGLKLSATCWFGLFERDPALRPFVVLSWHP